MVKRKRPGIAWEMGRCLSAGKLAAAVGLMALFHVIDFYSDAMSGDFMKEGDSVLYCFLIGGSGTLLASIGLCLPALLGAGLYARDYEAGAVCARVQRMGTARYACLRVWQTAVSAFLAGSLGLLAMLLAVSAAAGNPLLPDSRSEFEALKSVSDSHLLLGGHVASYLALLLLLAGLRAVFYAVLTLAASLAVPRWRLLVAVPVLLCYLFQFILPWADWLPPWLLPSMVFDLQGGLNPRILAGDRLNDWGLLGIVAGVLVLLSAAVWLLMCLRLRRNGIFGGERSE